MGLQNSEQFVYLMENGYFGVLLIVEYYCSICFRKFVTTDPVWIVAYKIPFDIHKFNMTDPTWRYEYFNLVVHLVFTNLI